MRLATAAAGAPPLASPAAGRSTLRTVEHRDCSLHTTQSTFAGLLAGCHLDRMSTRLSLYPCQVINKRGRIDPDCRPLRSQPIPHESGKVVVQVVVYLPCITTWKPVHRTHSVLQAFAKGLLRHDPLQRLESCRLSGPGKSLESWRRPSVEGGVTRPVATTESAAS